MKFKTVVVVTLFFFNAAAIFATNLTPALSSITISSFDADWNDVEGASFITVLSSDPAFSSIISSATISVSSISYTNLDTLTSYYFEVKISTEDDSSYESVMGMTSGPAIPPPDISSPTVAIVSPVNGSTVAAAITISGTAQDDVGLLSVLVQVDTNPFVSASGLDNWTFSLDTLFLTNGPHTVTVQATDTSSNTAVSNLGLYVANAPPPDVSSPIVAIVSPLKGSTVSATITISGTAQDNVGLLSVLVKVDDFSFGPAVGLDNWNFSINTPVLPNGVHTVTVQATDTSSNTATTTISLNIQNAPPPDISSPTVSIVSPVNGSTVSATITISGTAQDNVGLLSVLLKVDTNPFISAAGLDNWTFSLDTLFLTNGPHTVTVQAKDTSSNTTVSNLGLYVANAPPPDVSSPTVAIISPVNGSTVSATITISGTAQDNVGLLSVMVKVDTNSFVPATGLANWSFSLNTIPLSNGMHALTVQTKDTSSNTVVANLGLNVQNVLPPSVSATTESGVTVLSQVSKAESLQQILITLVQAKVTYSNNISLTFPPGYSVATLATPTGLTATSVGSILLSIGSTTVKGSGTVSLQNNPQHLSVSLDAGPSQNLQISNLATNAKTLGITLNPASGAIKTEIAPGAFLKDVILDISASMGPQSLPQVTITPNPSIQPVKNISISMAYLPESLRGADPNSLLIARFDEPSQKWIPAAPSFDRSNGKITALTGHLSRFQLMLTGAVSGTQVFPNPLRLHISGHKTMTFRGLRAGGTVKVFTLLGELVREVKGDASGEAFWDAKNGSGEKVASGGYLALVQGLGDSETTLTIAVER